MFSKSCFGMGKCPLESPLPVRPFPSLVEVPAASIKQKLPSFTTHCKEKPFCFFSLFSSRLGVREMEGGWQP